MKNLFNIIGFQLSWWACVLGVLKGYPYLGPMCMLLFILVHIGLYSRGLKELLFIFVIMIFGTFVDTIFSYLGILSYLSGYFNDCYIAPLWISAMWGGFSATVNHSMSKLIGRPFLIILLGCIFGPLAYMAGLKFGIIIFHLTIGTTLIILSFFWGLSMHLIFKLNEIIDV